MKHSNKDSIWVFMGENARHPCAVFTTKELAAKWIAKYLLSGILSEYPLNQSVYHWAVDNGYFSASESLLDNPEFISKFSSAHQRHIHFENGNPEE